MTKQFSLDTNFPGIDTSSKMPSRRNPDRYGYVGLFRDSTKEKKTAKLQSNSMQTAPVTTQSSGWQIASKLHTMFQLNLDSVIKLIVDDRPAMHAVSYLLEGGPQLERECHHHNHYVTSPDCRSRKSGWGVVSHQLSVKT